MLTQTHLRAVLHYDPDTGLFTWSQKRPGVIVGAECGRLSIHGYREIGVGGKLHRAHRLAFLYMTGEMPNAVVDHINGVKHDNRWCNLRQASQSQNMANVGIQRDNTSGVHGVVWDAQRMKWRAQICTSGKKRNLGRYNTIDEAAEAYKQAALEHWGEFCLASR